MTAFQPLEFEIRVLQNVNGKGFYFTAPYFYTLALLATDGPFTQQQLLEIFKLYGDMAIDKSWSKKVVKMKDLKFLSSKNINIRKRNGMQFNFVEITENGMNFLKETGFVWEKANPRNNSTSDHTIGIRQVVVDVLKVIAENKALGGRYVTSRTIFPVGKCDTTAKPEHIFRFYQDEKLGVNDSIHLFKKTDTDINFAEFNFVTTLNPYTVRVFKDIGVIPDWTFRLKSNLFHVEVDSGKQSFEKKLDTAEKYGEVQQTTIKHKIERYIQLAKELHQFNHHTVFVLLDDSVTPKKYFGNRATRIRNLKDGIGELLSKNSPNNLKISVISLERSKAFFKAAFLGALKSEHEVTRMNTALQLLHKSNEFKYHLTPIKFQDLDKWEVLTKQINISTPYVFSLYSQKLPKGRRLFDHMLIPIIANEGEALVKIKVEKYTEMIRNAVFVKSKILLIYKTKESMDHDLLQAIPKRNKLDNSYFNKVLMMPLDEWESGNQNLYTLDLKPLDRVELAEFLIKD